MTPLRQRFLQDLRLRNYSPRTLEAYVSHVARFARHFGQPPDRLGPEHVRQYQLHLLQRRASWSQFNQAAASLRFFYRVTLGRADVVGMVPYGKRPKALPCVLSPDEVRRLFDSAAQPRGRLLLQTTYACGLRAGEVIRLKVTDIDSARMLVHVRLGKGGKDRLVPLSATLLGLLRDYWRRHRPRDWLFPGATPAGHKSIGQAQRVCRNAVRACGLTKKASLHTLRHSYATHLLEAGVDLPTLQKLLGHSQLSTTLLYTHIRQSHLQQVRSPLDTLPAPAAPAGAVEGPGCLLPAWTSAPSSPATPAR